MLTTPLVVVANIRHVHATIVYCACGFEAFKGRDTGIPVATWIKPWLQWCESICLQHEYEIYLPLEL